MHPIPSVLFGEVGDDPLFVLLVLLLSVLLQHLFAHLLIRTSDHSHRLMLTRI